MGWNLLKLTIWLSLLVLGTQTQEDKCGYFYVAHVVTGRVIDASGDDQVHMEPPSGNDSQLWWVEIAVGEGTKGERIMNLGNGLALAGQGTDEGVGVVTYEKNDPGPHQRFYFMPIGTGKVLILNADKPEFALNDGNGKVTIEKRNNGSEQMFMFVDPCCRTCAL